MSSHDVDRINQMLAEAGYEDRRSRQAKSAAPGKDRRQVFTVEDLAREIREATSDKSDANPF